jgi:hypothetical protein
MDWGTMLQERETEEKGKGNSVKAADGGRMWDRSSKEELSRGLRRVESS